MNWIETKNDMSEINYLYYSAKSKYFQHQNIKFRLIFKRNKFVYIFYTGRI